MKKIVAVVLASASLGVCGAAMVGTSAGDVVLGTVVLDGGTETVDVSPYSIPPGGNNLVGKLTNKTGAPMDDVSVCVVAVGSSTTPPTSGGEVTVSSGGKQASATPAVTPDGRGYCADVELPAGGAGTLGPIANGSTVDVDVPVATSGDAGDLRVNFTPSVDRKGTDTHADLLATSRLSEATPGMVQGLTMPFHAAASMSVVNDGGRSRLHIVSLYGKATLPAGVSLASMLLRDPSRGYETVPGASVTLDGDSFSITGFGALKASQSYELLIGLSGPPAAGYRILVEAGFAEDY